jgi:hypothetical protein
MYRALCMRIRSVVTRHARVRCPPEPNCAAKLKSVAPHVATLGCFSAFCGFARRLDPQQAAAVELRHGLGERGGGRRRTWAQVGEALGRTGGGSVGPAAMPAVCCCAVLHGPVVGAPAVVCRLFGPWCLPPRACMGQTVVVLVM